MQFDYKAGCCKKNKIMEMEKFEMLENVFSTDSSLLTTEQCISLIGILQKSYVQKIFLNVSNRQGK